jgi:16S rRNA (guanine966-N2)-methyltransferase
MPRPPKRPARSSPAATHAAAAEATSPPRIIGGHLGGRRLAHSPDGRTRPMKDRVRESLFDLIGTSVRGSLALDLFAGTGALGFEALSRGAARALFVERHFPTADTLRRSAAELGVTDACDIRAGDVLLWPRRMPDLARDLSWIAFVSPPWEFFAAGHPRRADLLALIDALVRAAPPRSVVAVEADATFDPVDLPAGPGAIPWDTRPIPPAVLHLWHAAG